MRFEERISIWPAVGARWRSKLKTLKQKVLGSNDVPHYPARLAHSHEPTPVQLRKRVILQRSQTQLPAIE